MVTVCGTLKNYNNKIDHGSLITDHYSKYENNEKSLNFQNVMQRRKVRKCLWEKWHW